MNKKKILIGTLATVLLVSGALLYVLFGKSDELYGRFEYVSSSGEKSVIEVQNDYVIFDNIDYESCEKYAASIILMEEEYDNDTVVELSAEEKEKRKNEIVEGLNFKESVDKKKMPYRIDTNEEDFSESSSVYIVVVDDCDCGIRFKIDKDNKICSLISSKKYDYKYSGK